MVLRLGAEFTTSFLILSLSRPRSILTRARRAHPVRGKGRAHLKQNNPSYEPSFSLTRADARHNHERKFVMPNVKPLPSRPSLEQYKKQAKDLVKTCKAGDAEALHRVKQHHPRLDKLPDADIPNAKFALADAQLVSARENGFPSWPTTKENLW